jgi:hypothetical protein
MGWIIFAGFILWLIFRISTKKIPSTKDDFSGDTVESLFLLETLIDDRGREEQIYNTSMTEDDPFTEEWLEDDDRDGYC